MKSVISTKFAVVSLVLCVNSALSVPSNIPWQHPRYQHPNANSPQNHADESLSVNNSSGIVTDFINSSYPDVRQFLDVPFAEPPTGPLRFEPPKKLQAKDNDHIDATKPPPACPQMAPSKGSIFSMSSPEFFNQQPWDEDYLSLSIWAPRVDKTKGRLPVIIWIHGMGLQSGSSSVPYQQPPAWIQRSKEHIVVALQYRLNIFGYPNAAGLHRTNFGQLDQRMGMEWGESSGAGAVDAQNFVFPDHPIVQGFLSDSGSALFPIGTGFMTVDPGHSNFSTLAKGLGCPSDPDGEAACMRKKPATDIINFLTKYAGSKAGPPLNFVATPDGIAVFANYTERYVQGKLSDKPAIFGTNANEGVAQVPLPPNPETMAPNQTQADMATLGLFQCPAYVSSLERAKGKRKTFLYQYTGNFTDISPLFWEGAYHMSELPLVFGTIGQFHGPASQAEIKTSNAMQDLWLGFAKDPQNADSAGWAEFSSGNLVVLGGQDDPVQKEKVSKIDEQCAKFASMGH